MGFRLNQSRCDPEGVQVISIEGHRRAFILKHLTLTISDQAADEDLSHNPGNTHP